MKHTHRIYLRLTDTEYEIDIVKFSLRTDSELMRKFQYVAEYNARSANRELEMLMKKHIAEFEQKHGKIEIEE